jgi:phosphatidylserine/phosphatidylglycerophosphate/cardiolipin synthase-like enzyme
MNRGRAAALALVAAVLPHLGRAADSRIELHWSPAEDLERIDVALIGTARRSIDLAAYDLTDFAIIEALQRRAAAGVAVRIYLDPEQLGELLRVVRGNHPLIELARTANVEVRVKRPHVLMHLKAYAVDGEALRFGSANFSPSGLKRQDNELAIVRNLAGVARFEPDFKEMWRRPTNLTWRGDKWPY